MITLEQYYMGRDKEYPPTEAMEGNALNLLGAIAKLEARIAKMPLKLSGFVFELSSGYRPGKYNKAAGGSGKSAHLTCEAIDLKDPTGWLAHFLTINSKLLEELGLYMEHPSRTKGWVHLQTRKTRNRIFYP